MSVDVNKDPKNYVGINKRLYERRLELDYSVTEACIKLDISSTKLHLIERGYIKVKKPQLQAKFIHKYGLDENFFTEDVYKYPTLIHEEEESKEETNKFYKFLASWKFKIATGILCLGGLAMTIVGLNMIPRITNDTQSFFSETIRDNRNFVMKNGVEMPMESYLIENIITPAIISDDYYTFEVNNPANPEQYSVNVAYPKLEENLSYTFTYGRAKQVKPASSKIAAFFLGTYELSFETRMNNNQERIHLYATSNLDDGDCYNISFDYNIDNHDFKFNNVTYTNANLLIYDEKLPSDSISYYLITEFTKEAYFNYRDQANNSFQKSFNFTFEKYEKEVSSGAIAVSNFERTSSILVLIGLILTIINFALVLLSIIAYFKIDEKISAHFKDDDLDNAQVKESQTTKELPKNRWPHPFIPERVVRIFIILTAFSSSITLYLVFANLINLNISGVVQEFAALKDIGALMTASMLLMFFIKLDILQSKKKTFVSNYILFFVGLIYYFILLIVEFSISSSKSVMAGVGQSLLEALPGNIIWGILAFNLMSTFLFSNPQFKTHEKGKTIAFRLCTLIPISYMIASSVFQVCKKTWVENGIKIPLAVSSLFFSKATILTMFAIIFCLAVFLYRRYTVKKFGKEKALIYQNGNRYLFIKNIIASLIILALGLFDTIVSNCWTNNPIDAGGFYTILFCIPIILFYHPHLGKRNGKWDLSFIALYGFSLVIGILLISSYLIQVTAYL